MSDSWDYYPTTINGKQASIALDLGYTGADAQRPWLLGVRVHLKAPNTQGLCTNAEAPEVNAYEDALGPVLAQRCDAVQVGRLTCDGSRELFYYASSAEKLPEALAQAAPSASGHKVQSFHREDREWRHYLDFLVPKARSRQWMSDRKRTEQLTAAGDALEKPRPVDHRVTFPDAKSREQFLDEARKLGFQPSPPSAPEKPGEFPALVVRNDPVILQHIHNEVWRLRDLAVRFGGRYGGWGCSTHRDS